MSKKYNGPKVLVLDIETKPIEAYVWDIWEQNIPLNMIISDWVIFSWSAKWLETKDKSIVYGPHRKMMHQNQSKSKDFHKDEKKAVLLGIWELMNEADVIIGQNSKAFDVKKLNARFLKNKMKPPSPYKQYDTKIMVGQLFALTSKKLEYMSSELNEVYKKLTHSNFPGFSLWKSCIAGIKKAWVELKVYNNYDVYSTEELFNIIAPWCHVDFNVFQPEEVPVTCSCGSNDYQRRGYSYTTTGRYQRYACLGCGAWSRGKKNMLTKDKRELLKGKA